MFENVSKLDKATRATLKAMSKFHGKDEVNLLGPKYPRVFIPSTSMDQDLSDPAGVSKWLDELLCSSKNIEILAENSLGAIGKGDEDLRMRVMGSECLEMYKEATERIIGRKRFLNVSSELYHLTCIYRFLKQIFSLHPVLLLNDVARFLYPLPFRPDFVQS